MLKEGKAMRAEYRLGLDIGIASVGWCVIGEGNILGLGVRAFDKAETDKEGESLNLIRRNARLMRHRLHNRAWRLTKLTRLLKRSGVIDSKQFFKELKPSDSTWLLRVKALDYALDRGEFARIVYHICKHRGFYWTSKAESENKDNGDVKEALSKNAELMKDKGYRTVAEMILREFPQAQRNKDKEYDKALSRVLLGEELKTIFEKQRSLGAAFASKELQTAILGNGDCKSGLFWSQKQSLSGEKLLEMTGRCVFEKEEYRAPKYSFCAERHVLLTRINNLRIIIDGKSRALNDREREVAIKTAYSYANCEMKYEQLRSALVKAKLLNDFSFSAVKGEKEKLVKLPATLALKKALKDRFNEIANNPDRFDSIAFVLTVYKEDNEKASQLRKLGLDEDIIEKLLPVSFKEFHHLSLTALRKILPFMERGDRYDEAVVKAGYKSHSDFSNEDEKQIYLPPLYKDRDKYGRLKFNDALDIPRNPVVLRALNQARKVLNTIVKKYGSSKSVHIEMARDLSRSLSERKEIERGQKEYRERNEREYGELRNKLGREPKAKEFEKWLLYKEQLCKCAYSVDKLDIDSVLGDKDYAQIDHILPYSRSFDNSKNNRVLVKTAENQKKGNKTPFEYFGHNEDHWRKFEEYVKNNHNFRKAKRDRLLRKDFDEKTAEGFKERNLNDTRYICRFFKNYVERFLKLADDSDAKRVVVLTGSLTAFLRARWGLTKERGESDRHHALDASVIAVCNHAMVKRLSDYARRRELEFIREGFVDPETGEIINSKAREAVENKFPYPWENFREELLCRLNEDDPHKLREKLIELGTPIEVAQNAKPLFVSRAPQRRNGGAAHKETIYAKTDQEGIIAQRVRLYDLKLSDIDKLVDQERNKPLYEAIRKRMEEFNGNAQKAFSEPFYKPSKDMSKAPIVRSVKKLDKMSGIAVRNGIAKNDTMLRVDIFAKHGRFYLIPVYVWHKAADLAPNRAIVAYKDEDEWTEIDKSFEFCFSLYPNDLVKVTQKDKTILGYYGSTNRSTGAVNIWSPDRDKKIGKDGEYQSIGIKTALSIEKFNVDCLGNIYPASKESRRGLA
ncbi:MAG: type II CRISPR RNA-guided endonuclease Cas9 [Helicobacteraceae bacterium]|jgi:CRISPR-associated endonuclease Csn1|nr:type II CRISPR RNA-guided endonuclease Cas9 [Helicobacteraceae bacterium]